MDIVNKWTFVSAIWTTVLYSAIYVAMSYLRLESGTINKVIEWQMTLRYFLSTSFPISVTEFPWIEVAKLTHIVIYTTSCKAFFYQ